MNKRFLTIAAALSMGVALTACSSGGDEGKTGGSSVANAEQFKKIKNIIQALFYMTRIGKKVLLVLLRHVLQRCTSALPSY